MIEIAAELLGHIANIHSRKKIIRNLKQFYVYILLAGEVLFKLAPVP